MSLAFCLCPDTFSSNLTRYPAVLPWLAAPYHTVSKQVVVVVVVVVVIIEQGVCLIVREYFPIQI